MIVEFASARVLFLLAWLSRMFVALTCAHWGLVAGAFLIGVPIDWAADYTLAAVVLVGAGIVGLLGVFGRTPSVVATMQEGPGKISRFSLFVLSAALASNAGGAALLLHGHSAAGWWAMTLGCVVFVCEVSALLGHIYAGSANEAADE